jgi:hypothetical protein
MTTNYTPQAGSIAYKVIEFFTTNTDEVLTTDDLEAKFGKAAAQFHSILAAAVQAGVLKRKTNDDDELVYSLGKGTTHIAANPGRHPNLQPDALLAGTTLGRKKMTHRISINKLDLDKIDLRDNVPLPDKRSNAVEKLTALLARMSAGQSCELPIAAKTSLSKVVSQHHAEDKGKYAIRKLNNETIGLWRLA